MKKLFLALMLVAAVATGFVGCQKNTSDSENHTQTFKLGEVEFAIDNAITIQNIQYQGSEVYNTIILSQGSMIGETGGDGQGVVIVFRGDLTAGTYEMSGEEEAFPKYFIAQVGVEDIVNFDLENYENNEDAYMAISGTLTLEAVDGKYVVTSDAIEVINYKDNSLETSSVDFEGETNDFILATVYEGSNLNGEPIVTAGTTKVTLLFFDYHVACFITEEGNFIGFSSENSFANGLPVGELSNDDYPILLVDAMDISTVKTASSGTVNVARTGDWYSINLQATIDGTEYILNYAGTVPYFDFPF